MTNLTVAACTGCGRGYVRIHHDGIACMACGAPVRMLPAPEVANDDRWDRERWLRLVNQPLPPNASDPHVDSHSGKPSRRV